MSVKVSVIIPCFNAEKTVERCVESVLNQDVDGLEVLCIDNSSQDCTLLKLQNIAANDHRIRVLRENTPGAAAARNLGIAKSVGRYLAFLDADDTWETNKLSAHLSYMARYQLAFSWTNFYRIRDKDGKRQSGLGFKKNATRTEIISKRAVIATSTVMVDRLLIGEFLMPQFRLRQDWLLWIELVSRCQEQSLFSGGLDLPLTQYFVSSRSLSGNKFVAARAQWRALREGLRLGWARSAYYMIWYSVMGILQRLR